MTLCEKNTQPKLFPQETVSKHPVLTTSFVRNKGNTEITESAVRTWSYAFTNLPLTTDITLHFSEFAEVEKMVDTDLKPAYSNIINQSVLKKGFVSQAELIAEKILWFIQEYENLKKNIDFNTFYGITDSNASAIRDMVEKDSAETERFFSDVAEITRLSHYQYHTPKTKILGCNIFLRVHHQILVRNGEPCNLDLLKPPL